METSVSLPFSLLSSSVRPGTDLVSKGFPGVPRRITWVQVVLSLRWEGDGCPGITLRRSPHHLVDYWIKSCFRADSQPMKTFGCYHGIGTSTSSYRRHSVLSTFAVLYKTITTPSLLLKRIDIFLRHVEIPRGQTRLRADFKPIHETTKRGLVPLHRIDARYLFRAH